MFPKYLNKAQVPPTVCTGWLWQWGVNSADLGLSVFTPTCDGAWWRGGQHEMEEGKDGRKGARKVKKSNWEDGWWQSNEETAQTHTCMHAVTQTGIRAQVHTLTHQQRIHTSQTAALGYVSKEHVFKQAFTQTCRTDIQRNQEKRWKGDRYSSKKMEDDKKGWGKGQSKVQENWEKKLNEEKPTKEILSVCYTRACI